MVAKPGRIYAQVSCESLQSRSRSRWARILPVVATIFIQYPSSGHSALGCDIKRRTEAKWYSFRRFFVPCPQPPSWKVIGPNEYINKIYVVESSLQKMPQCQIGSKVQQKSVK